MPGVIPHLVAGLGLSLIGGVYLKYNFKDKVKKKDHILLFFVCILFSLTPDFPLGLYYIFHILPLELLLEYHSFLHQIITPMSLLLLLFLLFLRKSKTSIIWIMGMICILVHIAMDLYIHEGGVWI